MTSGWCSMILKNPRVLLVEDDPELARALSDLLKKGGCQVRLVTDGHTAQVAVGEFNPDLVISDLNLPHVTGSRLLGELRRSGFEKPAIIISGSGEPADFSEAFKNSVHTYLVKPFEIKTFVASIQRALSSEFTRLLREQETTELMEMVRPKVTPSEIRSRALERLDTSRRSA